MEKQVSPRISFTKTNDFLEVRITQKIASWKEILLGLWLLLWAGCGLVFVIEAMKIEGAQRWLFVVIIAFWAFFFFRIGKVFMWRRIGVEVLRFAEGKLSITNRFGSVGKPQFFSLDNVNALNEIKLDNTSFFQFMDNSFWIIGGDRLGFSHMSKQYQFGKQISEMEVRALKPMLNKALREYKVRDRD
jgi:hypothetical protein